MMEQVEELLACPVCLDRFKEPKILPCQHTFCLRPCLQNIVQNNSVRCPVCRSRHSLPQNGVEGLPTSLTIVSFLDLPSQQTSHPQCKECEMTTNGEVGKCNHCDKSLCRSCIASHTRGLQQDLQQSLTQVRRLVSQIAETDSDFQERLKKSDENGRTVKREISQSIDRFISELHSRKKRLLEDVDELVAANTGSLARERGELEVKLAALTSYCQAADGKCKRPLALDGTLDIQQFQSELLFLAQQGREHLQSNRTSSNKECVRQTMKFTNRNEDVAIISAISHFGTVSAHTKVTLGGDFLPDMEPRPANPQFGRRSGQQERRAQPPEERVEPPTLTVASAARPRTSNRRGREIQPSGSSGSDVRSSVNLHVTSVRTTLCRYRSKGQVKKYFGTKGVDPGRMEWPRGISSTAADDIVVADSGNHRVQIFDVNGNVKGVFGSYGKGEGHFDCVTDVCVTSRGWIVASDRFNHRIQIFDEHGRFVRQFGGQGSGQGQLRSPWGVATDDMGLIYVCDKRNRRVQVFSVNGEFVRKFGSEESRLDSPQYVSVTGNGRVVVGDPDSNRVQVFDKYGRHLFMLGMEGTTQSRFKFPKGVATDPHGNIIIGDSGNDRIQVFTTDATFVSCFGRYGYQPGHVRGLEGICILSNGDVAVSDRDNNRIQIF